MNASSGSAGAPAGVPPIGIPPWGIPPIAPSTSSIAMTVASRYRIRIFDVGF